jgi:hypothetical protein
MRKVRSGPSVEAPSFTALDGRITRRDLRRIQTKIIRVNSRDSRAEFHAIRGNWRNSCLFSPHKGNSAVTILSARSVRCLRFLRLVFSRLREPL